MEDHRYELVGAQEWQLDGDEPAPKPTKNRSLQHGHSKDVTLDNIKAQASTQHAVLARTQNTYELQNSTTSGLVPKGPSPAQPYTPFPTTGRTVQAAKHPDLGNQGVPIASSASRTRPVWVNSPRTPNRESLPQANNPSRSSQDTPAKAAWRAGHPCTGRIKLPAPYGQLKQKVIDHNRIKSPGEAERIFFGQIMAESGTFIAPPHNGDQVLRAWGTSNQVRHARLLVSRGLAMYTPQEAPTKKKSDHFVKIQSYCEQKEERISQVEKHDLVLQLLRQKPDPSSKFPETLVFLWPTDELPMDASLGLHLEALDPLRVEFGCPIYVDDELPNCIRVDAYDHDTILKIVDRLRAEWAELLATMHVKIRLYLVQPPRNFTNCEFEISRSQTANGIVLSIPTLHGVCMDSAPNQNRKQELIRTKNENRLREALTRSLQGLRFLRGHVRMRVNFGTFVLDEYRVPKGKPRYSYEEFRAMLFHSKTKGHLIPGLNFGHAGQDLLTRIATATDLLSPYDATSTSLEDAKPLYAVNFEFAGEDASVLRLEAEFARSPGSELFEVSQRRWIRPQESNRVGDKRPPLQIGIIDFESSDWQLEIRALDFQEPSSIAQSLRAFSHSIHFKPGAVLGFRQNTGRRVTFSNLVPVNRLVEKTALRYRLKGTSYILEVARYDEYFRAMPGTNEITEIPMTSWGASIFDLQWDNMLGQHANFRLGHKAEWIPSLSTFFPSVQIAGPPDVCTGFDQFMELVKRVAFILSPAPKPGTVMALNTAVSKMRP
ncbi:hypothetical protein PRK78_001284 [Emydomyces testavorans]|uniref:DUF7905 domain-containing protein n=1 Tax=Emydomyces testavorans TaxID=2070801 RepID=A0AAF0DDS8_9EURO|nr:hypothetical protein PRK78_001284 [Emydomyces testavorans]